VLPRPTAPPPPRSRLPWQRGPMPMPPLLACFAACLGRG
jgi:hypothetical protein